MCCLRLGMPSRQHKTYLQDTQAVISITSVSLRDPTPLWNTLPALEDKLGVKFGECEDMR